STAPENRSPSSLPPAGRCPAVGTSGGLRRGPVCRHLPRHAHGRPRCVVPPRLLPSRRPSPPLRLQALADDHYLLHLARALVDPQRANLAVEPLHRRSPHHAEAAVELQAPIDHPLRVL